LRIARTGKKRSSLPLTKESDMTEDRTVSQDERMLAALAHGGILLGLPTNGIGGIAAALVIWLTQRDRSTYVAFQALQALIYQVIVLLFTMMLFGCWGILWLLMVIPSAAIGIPSGGGPPSGVWVGLALLACPLTVSAILVLYGLWGAIQALGGKDFRYLIIGPWLERRLAA
jgi:uncharacterized Tic20 family protein